MDWQEIIALGIVGVTAAAFAWARVRRRGAGGGCRGCGEGAVSGGRPGVIYRAKKGERPQVIVKLK